MTAFAVATSLVLFGAVAPANAAPSSSTVVAKILADTNSARKSAGLAPLKLNTTMSSVASAWSKAQEAAGKMSHNPNYTKQIPKGWRTAGENVAAGYSYTAVTPAWLKSPGHRANLLNKSFTHIGIGYYSGPNGTYYTQVFGGYPPPAAKAPAAPSGVKVAPATSTGKVTWVAPKANGAKISRYEVAVYNTKTKKTVKVYSAATSKTVSGLSPSTRYTIKVKAQNAKGWSPASAAATLTTKK